VKLKAKRAAAAAAKQATLMERATAMAAPIRLRIRSSPHRVERQSGQRLLAITIHRVVVAVVP
jgi:hypothetical protein